LIRLVGAGGVAWAGREDAEATTFVMLYALERSTQIEDAHRNFEPQEGSHDWIEVLTF
jgi:hypothetical protein